MAINSVLHTNSQSIDRVLATGLPVMLVFWRSNVALSTEMDEVLDNLARAYGGRALIVKIDAAAEPELVNQYKVTLLPTLVLVKGGTVQRTISGRIPDSAIRDWMAHLVEGKPAPSVSSGEGVPAATGQPLYTNGASHRAADGPAGTKAQAGPITATDANFEQIINSDKPVLVDFWAPWCGPCRMVAPSVETLAREFAGRAVVAKLNVDENPVTAQRYNIMSIPALYIFRNGRVVDQMVGAQPLPVLRERLARAAA